MHHRLQPATLVVEPADEPFRVDQIRDVMFGQIAPALIAAEPVGDDNFSIALAQRSDDIRADKSRTSVTRYIYLQPFLGSAWAPRTS